MLAVLAVCLSYETVPIDYDKAVAHYESIRARSRFRELGIYNYLDGYSVENGNVRRLVTLPTPEHAKKMWEADHGKPWPKGWD